MGCVHSWVGIQCFSSARNVQIENVPGGLKKIEIAQNIQDEQVHQARFVFHVSRRLNLQLLAAREYAK